MRTGYDDVQIGTGNGVNAIACSLQRNRCLTKLFHALVLATVKATHKRFVLEHLAQQLQRVRAVVISGHPQARTTKARQTASYLEAARVPVTPEITDEQQQIQGRLVEPPNVRVTPVPMEVPENCNSDGFARHFSRLARTAETAMSRGADKRSKLHWTFVNGAVYFPACRPSLTTICLSSN